MTNRGNGDSGCLVILFLLAALSIGVHGCVNYVTFGASEDSRRNHNYDPTFKDKMSRILNKDLKAELAWSAQWRETIIHEEKVTKAVEELKIRQEALKLLDAGS